MVAVSFASYMSMISNSRIPFTVGDIMMIHTFLFIASFFIVIGLILMKNIWVRSSIAVFLLITYWFTISLFRSLLERVETTTDPTALVQLEYAFVLHHSFVILFLMFLIVHSQWRQLKTIGRRLSR